MLGRSSFLLAVVAVTMLVQESFACNRVIQQVVVQQQAVPSYGCATCAAPAFVQQSYVPAVAQVQAVSYATPAFAQVNTVSYAQPAVFANVSGYGGGFSQRGLGGRARFSANGGGGGFLSGTIDSITNLANSPIGAAALGFAAGRIR
jgi:hypothetical protein